MIKREPGREDAAYTLIYNWLGAWGWEDGGGYYFYGKQLDAERDDLPDYNIKYGPFTLDETIKIAGDIRERILPKCSVCGTNDFTVPCAYPTEQPEGCLRRNREIIKQMKFTINFNP